jgi:hypothetical protein
MALGVGDKEQTRSYIDLPDIFILDDGEIL